MLAVPQCALSSPSFNNSLIGVRGHPEWKHIPHLTYRKVWPCDQFLATRMQVKVTLEHEEQTPCFNPPSW